MLGLEWLAVVAVRDPRLPVPQVFERDVRRVAAVAERRRVLGCRLDTRQQCVDRDSFPHGVELRPLRHAVDVDGNALRRQREELVPRPAERLVDLADDPEVPLVERHAWRRTCREHREVVGHVLPGRNAFARRIVASSAAEPT
jgi:hypothetical protein